ncbi:hypothetical protein IWX50DRAFT_197702 [Phyllosticta citricarpa]
MHDLSSMVLLLINLPSAWPNARWCFDLLAMRRTTSIAILPFCFFFAPLLNLVAKAHLSAHQLDLSSAQSLPSWPSGPSTTASRPVTRLNGG